MIGFSPACVAVRHHSITRILPAAHGIHHDLGQHGNITGSFDNIMAELTAAIDAFNAAQVPGIIVDLRGNPGGFDSLASFFGGLFYDHVEVYEHASFYDDDAGEFAVLPELSPKVREELKVAAMVEGMKYMNSGGGHNATYLLSPAYADNNLSALATLIGMPFILFLRNRSIARFM